MTHSPDEAYALRLDAEDPLAPYRDRFCLPPGRDGAPSIYFCGNSLGLMPKAARDAVEQELHDWATLGVEGHFHARTPWYSYHEEFRESGARLVGAKPGEVVMMNGLTVNLHLMMVSFYQPTPGRHKILVEAPAFPSDSYAIQSQLLHRGFGAAEGLIVARPRPGEEAIRTEDIEELLLAQRGGEVALVLLGAVNFHTGQRFDIPRITAAAKRAGAVVGFDLAHAAGNVPLALHDWDVDFAVWCSYKYLNAGPGAVAGCFVHAAHGRSVHLPRFAGWWGNDPATRFRMHLEETFVPREGADGWQLSNPPIFSLAPLTASLAIFDEAGMPALRTKSERLTGYLEYLIDRSGSPRIVQITPRDPAARGCQLSLKVSDSGRALFDRIRRAGVVCDFREPDVIRVAPVPLYNTFHEVWRFAQILARADAELAVGSTGAGGDADATGDAGASP